MSETCETIKIKSAHVSQGSHVIINKADFDEKQHEIYEPEKQETKPAGGDAPEESPKKSKKAK